jgi:ADP-ribose pyrophosphatase YjhB (NUDIX family)
MVQQDGATGLPPRSAVPTDAVEMKTYAARTQRTDEDVYYERDASYTEWLKWYREVEYPRYRHPDVTVDCVVLTVDESSLRGDSTQVPDCLKMLVVDRWTHPFRGSMALPGTFMRPEDHNDRAVVARMLRDRFDFDVDGSADVDDDVHIRQLQTFTGAQRDPRGQVVSIANVVYVQRGVERIKETEGVHWLPLLEVTSKPLAFDHNEIVATAVRRIRSQFAWMPRVFWSLPSPFGVTDALKLRASLFGEDYKSINRKNFKRKYQAVWVADHVEINPVTKMPVDFYHYEGGSFE